MKPSEPLSELFKVYDVQRSGQLTVYQLCEMYNEIRIGGISLPQVAASMEYVCGNSDSVILEELKSVLEEMDRRYYLVQDLQWEFALLDNEHKGVINVDKARFLFEAVHGKMFSESRWKRFLRQRILNDAPIPFSEMEVDLCNRATPDDWDLWNAGASKDEQPERRDKERHKRKEEERRMKDQMEKEESNRRRKEKTKLRKEIERKQKEEEARRQKQMQAEADHKRNAASADTKKEADLIREAEERAAQELEEKTRLEIEKKERAQEEETLRKEEEKKRREKEEKEREMKKAKRAAKKRDRESAHQKVYNKLEEAIESKEEEKLEPAIKEYKNKVSKKDRDEILAEAERLLEMLRCSKSLKDAMTKRMISDLEGAIAKARKSGFDQSETELGKEVAAADDLLLRLRRLEKLRAEVLELKQSTIAEIRSYKSPIPIIHSVMIATYLLLGVPEKETKKWQNVQMLLGRTGKEGLKRRISQCNVVNMQPATAKRARDVIGDVDLEAIRDVSAGAATFFIWAEGMIEEVLSFEEEKLTLPTIA